MATLSSLSSLGPQMLESARGFAEAEPVLEGVRKKRLERREQDRKEADTRGLNMLRMAQAKGLVQDEQEASTLLGILRGAPEVVSGDVQSLRNWHNYLVNTGYGPAIKIANETLQRIDDIIKTGPAGSTTSAGAADLTAQTGERLAAAGRDVAETDVLRTFSKVKPSAPTEIEVAAAREWAEQWSQKQPSASDWIPFNEEKLDFIRLATDAKQLESMARSKMMTGYTLDQARADAARLQTTGEMPAWLNDRGPSVSPTGQVNTGVPTTGNTRRRINLSQ